MIIQKQGPKSDDEKRYQKARADKLEIEVLEKRGQLIPIEEVEKEWTKMVLAFRKKMLNIPRNLAVELAEESKPVKITSILKEGIHEALEQLSNEKYRTVEEQSE